MQRLLALPPGQLQGMRRGIEQESLRPRPDARLGLTPHPADTWLPSDTALTQEEPVVPSVRQPLAEMSELSVKLIEDLVEGRRVQVENCLPVELMERETT